jgi:carboxypeptidase C (cathepsin A)
VKNRALISALALSVLSCAFMFPALAADPASSPRPSPAESAKPAEAASTEVVTHHSIVLNGKTIEYTAVAGNITLRDDKDQPTATMFYTAFTADGVTDKNRRAITFFYNGGPGSSTIWLRMGSFAPKRIEAPDATSAPAAPYRLVDNEYSLLDRTDMVFVDAPGTGFSRLAPKSKPDDFYGIDQDGRAFRQFVQRYVTQNQRWNSPKFLFGESYGTLRSCVLANLLQRQGMAVNGVVLLSSALNFEEFNGGDGSDVQFVTYLPTEAAVAWYHHKGSVQATDLPSLVRSARQFSIGQYASALALGSSLSPAARDDVIKKLHDYTGLSENYIRRANLRFAPEEFEKQLLGRDYKIVGRYDARYVGVDMSPNAQAPDFDPSYDFITSSYVSSFNDYIRTQLKYETDRRYEPLSGSVGEQWDLRHKLGPGQETYADVLPDLKRVMTVNPHLRVFAANGYYDLATPFFGTEYLLDHMGLDPSLASHITYGYYESGHMVYLHAQALAQFRNDLDRWYDAILSQS